jgi:hypothetical protein
MELEGLKVGGGCESTIPFWHLLKETNEFSFILEGIATVIVVFSAYFILYDFPDTASFLTIEERASVVHRLKYQGVGGFRTDGS